MGKNISVALSLPSKTFLLGEYLVLNDGPGLLINTDPRFVIEVSTNLSEEASEKTCHHPFDKNSPCAKFIEQYADTFQQCAIQFFDPFLGAGGFGASSAAFTALFFLRPFIENLKQKMSRPEEKVVPLKHVLLDPDAPTHLLSPLSRGTKIPAKTLNRNIEIDRTLLTIETAISALQALTSTNSILPSGADIAAQIAGDIAFFEKGNRVNTYLWPFTNTCFCLLKTKEKIKTHEHLAGLDFDRLPFSTLEKITRAGIHALQENDEAAFCQSISDYGDALIKNNLATEKVLPMLGKIRAQEGVKAAKGCGALSADVFFVVLDKEAMDDFKIWAAPLFSHVIIDTQTAQGVINHD